MEVDASTKGDGANVGKGKFTGPNLPSWCTSLRSAENPGGSANREVGIQVVMDV